MTTSHTHSHTEPHKEAHTHATAQTRDSHESQSALIQAQGISKSFAGRSVLQNVNLTVNADQAVTLIGPNGAGKTTLIRILLGLVPADSGTIIRQPDLRIGYMPQKVSVAATMPLSVRRFLQLARRQSKERIEQALALLCIEHLADQQLIALSGGEMQRVLMARALLPEPHLLILDEPAQGVDLNGQAELYQLIGHIRAERGCSVLMISHDLQLVMSATNEVVCLNHHVCCHGKPDQVSNDPAFIDLFGPNLSPGLALYTHHHNHEHDIGGDVKPCDSESCR